MIKKITKLSLAILLTATANLTYAQSLSYSIPSQLKTGDAITNISPNFSDYTVEPPYKVMKITGGFSATNRNETSTTLTLNRFIRPSGVQFYNSHYFIVDAANNNTTTGQTQTYIKKINVSNATVAQFISIGNATFGAAQNPDAIAIHPKTKKIYAVGSTSTSVSISQHKLFISENSADNDNGGSFSELIIPNNTSNILFSNPRGIAISSDGTEIYVANKGDNKILKITLDELAGYAPTGISVFAGSTLGSTDGDLTTAKFNGPSGIALDNFGNLFVVDNSINAPNSTTGVLRRITSAGEVTTLRIDNGNVFFSNTGEIALLPNAYSVVVSPKGTIYASTYLSGSNIANSSPSDEEKRTFSSNRVIWKITDRVEKIIGGGISATYMKPSGTTSISYEGQYPAYGTDAYLDVPIHLSIGRYGNLAFATRDDQILLEAVVEDRFTVSPALPAGLKLDDMTGIISGTPTETTPLKTYTITFNAKSETNTTTSTTISFATVETLPVSLTSFEAKKQTNGSVNITWTTASEKDNSHFTLAKSTDGTNFATLATKKALGNQGGTYNHVDTKVAAGANYYKLQQVDVDGTTTDLGIKVIQGGVTTAAWSVYPNPSNGTDLNIQYTGNNTSKLVKVYNLVGQQVFAKKVILNGTTKIAFASKLAAGIYTIQIEGLGTQKFIVK